MHKNVHSFDPYTSIHYITNRCWTITLFARLVRYQHQSVACVSTCELTQGYINSSLVGHKRGQRPAIASAVRRAPVTRAPQEWQKTMWSWEEKQ